MNHFHKRICYDKSENYKIVSDDLYKKGIFGDYRTTNGDTENKNFCWDIYAELLEIKYGQKLSTSDFTHVII